MKAFRTLCVIVVSVFLLLAALLNVLLIRTNRYNDGIYRVEAKRLMDTIAETGRYDLSDYPHLTGVFAEEETLFHSDAHYLITEANGTLYRVEYAVDNEMRALVPVNCTLALCFLILIGLLLYIRRHIILPFNRMRSVPQELAKGNLAVELPEERSRYFGSFTWGVNLLRESIEDSRKKEITMQRDKKRLLLSLSHDIRTPLSAIKMNASALAKGLYTDEEKRHAALESIQVRADEIKYSIDEIITAAGKDFLDFEVTQGEAFLSAVILKIQARYAPSLSVSGAELAIGEYRDCLLSCDPDRLCECLQNLMENAIKYGDGRCISMEFDRMDGCELITVSNTGCTLETKELPLIFDSFHRGSNAGSTPGNGLGLFICKRLMSRMGGDVYADIRNGAFRITLVVKLV